jgi:Methyltransferase domain
MLSDFVVSAFRLLPARFREQLKAKVGAAGHTASVVDAWRARRLARTWKRPDAVVVDMLEILDGIGRKSLNGCRVMDFGSGILPADAFGYSMFGASEVHAVDYTPLYQDRAFRNYVAQGDWRQFLPPLTERCGQSAAEDWLRRVSLAIDDKGSQWFHHVGLRYVAPFDLLKDAPPAPSYDLIASRSTMEHVSEDLAAAMVARMAQLVAPGGAMHHHIHLDDHRDISGNPYAFLSADDDYSPAQHDTRGNRLRASDWRRIFAQVHCFTCKETLLFKSSAFLPNVLAPRFRDYDPDDLRVTAYIVNCVNRVPPATAA